MTNMLQFSNEMDDISFVETSSIFDETDISMNVLICEEEGDPVRILFNQTLRCRDARVFTAAKTKC